MRRLTYKGKKYKFVNESTVDGVKHRLFRRTKRSVQVTTETVLVIGTKKKKKVTVIKNVKQSWRKIRRKKKGKKGEKSVNHL